jgi:hypothetical protein
LGVSLPGGAVYGTVYVTVEKERVVVVFLVGPHENIYDKAERRYRALRRGRRA